MQDIKLFLDGGESTESPAEETAPEAPAEETPAT